MQRRSFVLSCAFFLSLALTIVVFAGCSSGTSADSITIKDTTDNPDQTPTTTPSQVIGIYSGAYDGQTADFVCTGSDCLITVAGKSYAKGVFTNLQAPSASVRAVTFTANLKIIEKVNSDGLLCPVSTGETLNFVFPPEGSTDPIKLTVNGVTTDLSQAVIYVVTFDRQNNVKSYLPVKAGTALDLTDPIYSNISKGNYSLMKWCLDSACTKAAPNPLTVTGNMTLYAQWAMTSVNAPTVTDVAGGISIPVTQMPEGTNGLELFRVNTDGSWTPLYYRNGAESDFTRPIHYPFVAAGKACRYVMQYYDAKGYTHAVSDYFTVIPANGAGELSVSNADALILHIADGKIWMGAVPELSGAGATAVKDSRSDFELFKGNGFASESWQGIGSVTVNTEDVTNSFNMTPLPSGTNFFVHFVFRVCYDGDYDYRVFERESEPTTYLSEKKWVMLQVSSKNLKYTINDMAGGGVKIDITSNPDHEAINLSYYCDDAQGKNCTFSIPVKNCSATGQTISGNVRTNQGYLQKSLFLDAGTSGPLVMNQTEKVVTDYPSLSVTITTGSFEISNPVVTLNQ